MPKLKQEFDEKLHWYKDAIIYELHIKAFRDGDNDGIGDFAGLLEKLDYLEDLGVTAIWVLPFYPSPLKDDGYDIADYYTINPSYGTIKDFQRFLKEAHSRNLKVITELVINHTSDQHPWFQRARKAKPGSPERDFYVWTDDPTQYKDVRIIFQDFETSNWTYDNEAGQYYWHRFFSHQPDLNYDSPQVQKEVFKILDFWCRMGVDGFRLDAVPYLFEREGTNGENLPETHEFLKKLRAHIDKNFPGTLLLAEANMWPEDSAAYFGDGDECHMNYHFPVMPRMFMALQMEDRYPITDIFDQTPEIPETCQWAIFLRNHDELTLEMVTDEERDYMYKVYAKDPKAKINLGIRHRLAPLVENNRRKIELLNFLLFSLKGTPVIYYGDEIGMGDNFYLGDRDGVRTPMQWSPDRNGGFSQANPQRLYLPLIQDPEYHYLTLNVETQSRSRSSLLWFMKQIIHMRKNYKAFSRGSQKFVNGENPKVLSFLRTYEEQTILVVVNLSRYSQATELDLDEFKGYVPIEVFSKNKFFPIYENAPYALTMGPHACYWFILEKVNPAIDENKPLPELRLPQWKDLAKKNIIAELEKNILPEYIVKTNWFRGRGRNMHKITITDIVAVPSLTDDAFMTIVEVSYETGFPGIYQMPLTCLKDQAAANMQANSPQAVICRLRMDDGEALLVDAMYSVSFVEDLFKRTIANQDIPLKSALVNFNGTRLLKKAFSGNGDIKARINPDTDSHLPVSFNNEWFLKMYRRVDRSVNPDLEISSLLSEKQFRHVPPFAGSIVWEFKNSSIVLGMIQKLVEYHGDGWTYMLERLEDLRENIVAHDPDELPVLALEGSFTEPVSYEAAPQELKELLGGPIAEGLRLIGERTGEMHKALASIEDYEDFRPENFSLHYQRSLYAGFQSLVREAYQGQAKNIKRVPEEWRPEIEEVMGMREKVLAQMKRIHARKMDIIKIRHHGNYHLGQILFSGKDVMIRDFGGDPNRSYSERRLKRSPLRDVAFMVRSIHYAAHKGILMNDQIRKEDMTRILPYVPVWTHYVSGFFMDSYLQTVAGSRFIPKNQEDLKILFNAYLLEKLMFDLSYELRNRPEWAIVPARMVKMILQK